MVGVPEELGIKFGIRGDNLLQTRNETASQKKIRNFKADFENYFWEVFGTCQVEFAIRPNERVRDVTMSINEGDLFDVLVVCISVQDLVDPNSWAVNNQYPPSLDDDLMSMALAIKSKAKGSLVLMGGPAKFWERPPRWDSFMARASNVLRKAGVQVVPAESSAHLFEQMVLSSDGFHFSNIEDKKETFVKTVALWLQAASDPTWGLEITEEIEIPRERSRSPHRMDKGMEKGSMVDMWKGMGKGMWKGGMDKGMDKGFDKGMWKGGMDKGMGKGKGFGKPMW